MESKHLFVECDRPFHVRDAQHDMVEPLDPQRRVGLRGGPVGESGIIRHVLLLPSIRPGYSSGCLSLGDLLWRAARRSSGESTPSWFVSSLSKRLAARCLARSTYS